MFIVSIVLCSYVYVAKGGIRTNTFRKSHFVSYVFWPAIMCDTALNAGACTPKRVVKNPQAFEENEA